MRMALARFDLSVVLFLRQHRYEPGMARLARWISHTGDGHLYLLLAAGLALLESSRGTAFFVKGLAGFAIELPVYWVLKNTCRRDRPQQLEPRVSARITPHDQFSFPSGHTTAAFLMAGLVGLYYPAFYSLALSWAALIGLSRVMLGVHFLTDVVAGAALGTLIVSLL